MPKSINPATGELIKSYDEMDYAQASGIIDKVDKEFGSWKNTHFAERSRLMKNAAGVLRKRKEELSLLMTLEMGKPIVQSRGEIEKCAWVCEYYADNAEKFLTDEDVKTDAAHSFISYQPIGPVLAIMPWNFPYWQVFRFAAPALMAGNVGILKHSSNVTGSALEIEKIFLEAGFPENIFRTIIYPSGSLKEIIKHKKIMAVTLTGSTAAGKSVASAAGEVLKKCVLELGGSDPYIILEDADLEKAAELCVTSRLLNGGQSCIAAKRFIVVESVIDAFEELFIDNMKKKKMGDPLKEDTDIGPQARMDLRDEVHQQVMKSIEKGAKLLLGGNIPEGNGAYYPPTVLNNVVPGMPAYHEELFGPVASIIRVKSADDAIAVANDSLFGLGGAVFTKDIERGEKIAREKISSGCCFVNDFVKSDPRLPFGGVKESGFGRELSYFGIREFMNIKSIYRK